MYTKFAGIKGLAGITETDPYFALSSFIPIFDVFQLNLYFL